MRLPLYQVDAFTDRLFGGNPAAICPLEAWLTEPVMLAIAAENNLSETAFFVRARQGYDIRWFTPTAEVELCGHATLASAFVICTMLEPGRTRVAFDTTKVGPLVVTREGDEFALDFPAWPPEAAAAPEGLAAALGRAPVTTLLARARWLAVYDDADEVASIRPDFTAVKRLGGHGVVITAPGRDRVDFVSRYFAPAHGIDEDPVTGSTHCILAPYWAARLGKTKLRARQVSCRGGELTCTLMGERVAIAGRATLYLEGTITV